MGRAYKSSGLKASLRGGFEEYSGDDVLTSIGHMRIKYLSITSESGTGQVIVLGGKNTANTINAEVLSSTVAALDVSRQKGFTVTVFSHSA